MQTNAVKLILVGLLFLCAATAFSQEPVKATPRVHFTSPANGVVIEDFLATRIEWEYPHLNNVVIDEKPPALVLFYQMQLVVSERENRKSRWSAVSS